MLLENEKVNICKVYVFTPNFDQNLSGLDEGEIGPIKLSLNLGWNEFNGAMRFSGNVYIQDWA